MSQFASWLLFVLPFFALSSMFFHNVALLRFQLSPHFLFSDRAQARHPLPGRLFLNGGYQIKTAQGIGTGWASDLVKTAAARSLVYTLCWWP
jgi:hypothetical protein